MSTKQLAQPAEATDFADVYQDHLASVWRYVRSRVWHYHEAQDVTAEVFTRAWRSWPSYNPNRGAVAPWLFRIAQRTVVDWQRRRGKAAAVPASETPALEGAPATVLEGIEAALLDEEVGEPRNSRIALHSAGARRFMWWDSWVFWPGSSRSASFCSRARRR